MVEVGNRLYYTSKQTGGETNPETHWGETRNPPGHPETARVPGFPQTPFLPPPQTTTDPAAQMTEERRNPKNQHA